MSQPQVSRRGFLRVLGAGLLITVRSHGALAQRGGRGGGPRPIATRVHIAEDGTITVMTGKVELGQGARTEVTQAAAEERRVAVDRIRLIMGDTDLVPDDGVTAGSQTTPRTIPAVRRGAAAAREAPADLAAEQWQVDPAGGGETPIIAIAPAIAGAIFDAIGVRVRELPMRLPAA